MRLALAALPLLFALVASAQSPEAVAGTWYSQQEATVVMRSGSDSTATPLAVASVVTLELTVDGTTVMGEERRALSFPGATMPGRKDPVTVTASRAVEGTVEGDYVRLTFEAEHGAPLDYEGTFDTRGHHLSLQPVPAPGPRGEAPTEALPVAFARELPKWESRK